MSLAWDAMCSHGQLQAALRSAKEQVSSAAEEARSASNSGASASGRAQQLQAEVDRLQQALVLKNKAVSDAEQQVRYKLLLLVANTCHLP